MGDTHCCYFVNTPLEQFIADMKYEAVEELATLMFKGEEE